MELAARLILVLALMIQSMPGLAVQRCAAASAPIEGAPTCTCCGGGDDATPGCDASGQGAACCCGAPTPETPKPPPTDPNAERTHLLAEVPAPLCTITATEPAPLPRGREHEPVPRSARPTQSVLCVWVV